MKNKYSVIIPINLKPKPSPVEITAAEILANFLQADVKFYNRNPHPTPDFIIKGQKWELKTPLGKSENSIRRNVKSALRQSRNIVIDARFSKLHINKIKHLLDFEITHSKSINKLILICKDKKVLLIFEK